VYRERTCCGEPSEVCRCPRRDDSPAAGRHARRLGVHGGGRGDRDETVRLVGFTSTPQLCDLLRSEEQAAAERDHTEVTVSACRQAVVQTVEASLAEYWAFTALGTTGIAFPARELCDGVRGLPRFRGAAPSGCGPIAVQFLAPRSQ